jgi:hypothetical protein
LQAIQPCHSYTATTYFDTPRPDQSWEHSAAIIIQPYLVVLHPYSTMLSQCHNMNTTTICFVSILTNNDNCTDFPSMNHVITWLHSCKIT